MAELINPNFNILDALVATHLSNKLGHTLLFKTSYENEELDQNKIFSFAKTLLCLKQNSKECEECSSCLAIKNIHEHQHPDLKIIHPEKQSGYTIEQARDTLNFFSLKKALSPKRLLWIQNAEELSTSSGNALLKFLEEPQEDLYIILSSSNSQKILATILSRCQTFKLPTPVPEKHSLPEKLNEWKSFVNWIANGATPQIDFNCPADQESYWTDRKEALHQVEEVFRNAWLVVSSEMTNNDLQKSRRIYDFFHKWQESILKIKAYGNPSTNWMNLKNASMKGVLWKP